jgi:hypothetical protein
MHNKHSDYKGVNWDRKSQKWTASVTNKGIRYECGYHDEERNAAVARDKKIIALGLSVKLQVLKKVESNGKSQDNK